LISSQTNGGAVDGGGVIGAGGDRQQIPPEDDHARMFLI